MKSSGREGDVIKIMNAQIETAIAAEFAEYEEALPDLVRSELRKKKKALDRAGEGVGPPNRPRGRRAEHPVRRVYPARAT